MHRDLTPIVSPSRNLRVELTVQIKSDPHSGNFDKLSTRIFKLNYELVEGGLEARIALGGVPVTTSLDYPSRDGRGDWGRRSPGTRDGFCQVPP
jgi:hypothetical protein